MNWIQRLYETYNNCQASVGYSEEEGVRPLVPICHITTQAHIEIVINKDGDFREARCCRQRDVTTIIPSTESSASRLEVNQNAIHFVTNSNMWQAIFKSRWRGNFWIF